MSVEELFKRLDVLILEEKFAVLRINPKKPFPGCDGLSVSYFVGNYPLQPVNPANRGIYGGELVSQLIVASWETVPSPETYQPHSLHSHFVAAAKQLSPIAWVVVSNSNGRTFRNRLVRAYQLESRKLVFVATISFVKRNLSAGRQSDYQKGLTKQMPFYFQKRPMDWFFKYRHKLDTLPCIIDVHGMVEQLQPPELFQQESCIDLDVVGNRHLGVFFRVKDDWQKCRDAVRARVVDFAYALDTIYLNSFTRVLGSPLALPPQKEKYAPMFRVSLDHTIHLHDMDFDPAQWMFCDFHFSKMGNDRLMCQVHYFTLEGHLIATVNQEALVYAPQNMIADANASNRRSKL